MDLLKIASLLEQIAQEIRKISPEAVLPLPSPSSGSQKVKLADLQEVGRALLAKDQRDLFVGVLQEFGIANLSSAKEPDYPSILKALNVALGTSPIVRG